jgi:hypothetical protein
MMPILRLGRVNAMQQPDTQAREILRSLIPTLQSDYTRALHRGAESDSPELRQLNRVEAFLGLPLTPEMRLVVRGYGRSRKVKIE